MFTWFLRGPATPQTLSSFEASKCGSSFKNFWDRTLPDQSAACVDGRCREDASCGIQARRVLHMTLHEIS